MMSLLEISSSKFHLKNDGSVIVSGDITITGGDLAGVNTNTISGSADEVSSSLAGRQTPFETQVVLSSGGMSLNKDDGTSLASYGTTTRIGESGEARVEISNTALEMYDGADSPSKRVELDSSGNLTLGKSGEARTVLEDDSISLYSGKISGTSRKRVAIDNTGKAAFGGAVNADVSVSSTDDVVRITPSTGIAIYESSTNYADVTSAGLRVYHGGQLSASFGTTTHIGPTGGSHVLIDSTGVTTKFDSNNFSKMDSDSFDITLGGQISASFGTTTRTVYNLSSSDLGSTVLEIVVTTLFSVRPLTP